MEVAYVYLLGIHQLEEATQLQSRELARQQVEQGRRIELYVLPDEAHGLLDDEVMVEGQVLDIVQSYPAGLVVVQIAAESTINLHQRQIGYGHNALYLRLHGPFQPVHVFGILGPVLGTKGLELHQIDILQACQFIEYTLGGLIQVLVHIYQAAGKFHIVEYLTLLLSHSLHQQDLQLLAVKSYHNTIYRNMIVGQGHCMFHVLHNIFF